MGAGANIASSSQERAFWCKFIETHPKPPENLESEQLQLAEAFLKIPKLVQQLNASQPSRSSTLGQSLLRPAEAERSKATAGYPAEALTDDEMRWAYVMDQRRQYEEVLSSQPNGGASVDEFLSRLLVDPKLITEPLNEEQLHAANRWKIAYLQRLRKEKADDSYINAYLKAWNLSSEEVFASGP
jgi:hypothetical protein